MEEGLHGLQMGAAAMAFLLAMGIAEYAVSSCCAMHKAVEHTLMEQRNVTVVQIEGEGKMNDEWMKYLEK